MEKNVLLKLGNLGEILINEGSGRWIHELTFVNKGNGMMDLSGAFVFKFEKHVLN